MNSYRRLLASILVVALAGCGAAIPTAAKTTDLDQPTSADASGTLAYALDGDIYVADPDGSNAVKIADGRSAERCGAALGEYWAAGPMWSPDAQYLAYRYADCSKEEGLWGGVVISDAEGNAVVTFPSEGWRVAWSQDSTRVAVFDTVFETVGIYGLDGARQTQLTMPPGNTSDNDWAWMPDGTSLMVQGWELPLDGGTPRRSEWDGEAYSPDGSHVAYVYDRSLTIARSDGSGAREVFGDSISLGDVTWSATGDRVAFTDSTQGALLVLDVATGSVTTVLRVERGWSVHSDIGFSPQGDRILFARYEEGGEGERSLWSVGVDGSDPRLVVAGTINGDWLSR